MSLGTATSYAMHAQAEMPYCGYTGIPQDRLLCCKVMYRLCVLFISAWEELHGLNSLQRPQRPRNSVLTKNVTSDCQLWVCMSWFLVFLATQCSFLFSHSTELKNGIWKTEKSLILIKTAIHSFCLTFLLMKFIGTDVSVYTHLSTVLVICSPAFVKYFR